MCFRVLMEVRRKDDLRLFLRSNPNRVRLIRVFGRTLGSFGEGGGEGGGVGVSLILSKPESFLEAVVFCGDEAGTSACCSS